MVIQQISISLRQRKKQGRGGWYFLRARNFCLFIYFLTAVGCETQTSVPDEPQLTTSGTTDLDHSSTLASQLNSIEPSPAPESQSLWTRNQGQDWPRFLGTNSDGKSSETGIKTDWSAGKLNTLWSMPVGTSYGIGSVAAGRYFQHDRIDDKERLQAVRAQTGEKLWTQTFDVQYSDMYGYNNGPRDTPAIGGNDVFTFGVAGRLSCTDAITGKLKWSVDTNKQYGVVQNFFGVGSSSLVVDDLVLVMVGGSPAEDASIAPGRLDRVSSNGSALVAFDRRTGNEVWKTGNDLASYSSPRTMKLGDKTIVILFARDGLLAVNPDDGSTLWTFHHRADILESVNAMVPVVIDDHVFISECYGVGSVLLKVDLKGCNVVWQDSDNRREQTFRSHWATPVVVGDFIYGASGRNEPDSDLRCINWKTGQLGWADNRRSRTSVLYVDNHLVVLDESGLMQLVRIDPEKLSIITSIDLEQPAENRPAMGPPYWAAPILSHGLLYVRGSDHVACFELIDAAVD